MWKIDPIFTAITAHEHKHFNGFHDRIGHSLNGRRFLKRALPLVKLGLGNQRESGIRARFVRPANS